LTALWPLLAIFGRDWRLALSYRLNAVTTLASTTFSVMLWYFFALAVTPARAGWATGGYFAYLVTGTALMGYVNVALHTFARRLREEQMTGTLEMTLASPQPPMAVLFSSILWELTVQSLQVLATFAIAAAFGLRFHVASWGALIVLSALTILDFAALGIMAASLLLVFQRGEPVTPFVGALFALLGGVFFPAEVLPAPLEVASRLLPLTYALSGLRSVLLQGAEFEAVRGECLALLLFGALLLPCSLVMFRICLRFARKYGLLGTY
jgi:ABC-2 type transport system permease protein